MTLFLRPIVGVGIGTLLVLMAFDLHAQQTRVVVPSAQTSQVPTSGTAAITGVVVDAATDRPVAAAVVTLEERRPGERRRSSAQVTTATGRFAFVDLPASHWYFLTAAKPGYLDGGYRRADPMGPGAPVSVADDQWLRDVRVTLPRPGSISGAVIDERGEPVVGAYVRVLPQVLVAGRLQWLAGPVAQTDDRGAYRIAALRPGRYVVSVPSVQATLPASAIIRPPGASAGTSMSDLDTAREAARGEKLLVDLGAERRVVVGRYAIPPPPAPDGRRTAYPITFHPDVITPADATPIELGLGEARLNVDVRLRPALTARVSGRLIGPAEAIGNQMLRLMPVGLEELGQGSEAATTVTLADGRFDFLDVPAGSYLVELTYSRLELTYASVGDASTAVPAPVAFPSSRASSMSVHAAPPGVSLSAVSLERSDGGSFWARMPVSVSGDDVDNLDVSLRSAISLTGHIVMAPASGPPVRFPTLVLEPADGRRSLGMPMSLPVGPRRAGPPTPATPVDFTIHGLLPGQYLLRTFLGVAKVQSVAWESRDYTDRPFDATSGRDITGVVVTLTTATSSISGIVSDAADLPMGAAVIAFPAQREAWTNYGFTPARFRSALATLDGRYQIDALPAGEYYLVAVPAAQERAWLDPQFLASHAPRATRVRLDRPDSTLTDVALRVAR
jgi:hypothetical protein